MRRVSLDGRGRGHQRGPACQPNGGVCSRSPTTSRSNRANLGAAAFRPAEGAKRKSDQCFALASHRGSRSGDQPELSQITARRDGARLSV